MERNPRKPGTCLRALRMGLLVGLIAATAFLLAVFLSAVEWRPPTKSDLRVIKPQKRPNTGNELTLLTWNIGYASLDAESDFFVDGGKNSRGRSEAAVKENLDSIISVITETNPDILLLQEVDETARRSQISGDSTGTYRGRCSRIGCLDELDEHPRTPLHLIAVRGWRQILEDLQISNRVSEAANSALGAGRHGRIVLSVHDW